MNKPSDYDQVNVGGYEKVIAGPHIAVIKDFSVRENRKSEPMMVVFIDFTPEDVQSGYFKKQFDRDTRADKKWPHQATAYINEYAKDGTTNPCFKIFNSAYKKSNNCDLVWYEDNNEYAKQFKGKKIGVTYGEKEEEYNGKRSMRTLIDNLRFFDIHEFDKQSVPEPQYLPDPIKAETPASAFDEFMKIPEGDDDGLPFR